MTTNTKERKPWSDGIDEAAAMWSYTPGDRFTRKPIRNEALWAKTASVRLDLIAKALAWRDAAVADGWSSRRTYDHEDELRAFTLERDGFKIQGLARPGDEHSLGSGQLSCWGPDGLAIEVGEIYDWLAIQRAVETCHYCRAHPVKTKRVGFAGRCCAACLPEMQRRIETPGWTN